MTTIMTMIMITARAITTTTMDTTMGVTIIPSTEPMGDTWSSSAMEPKSKLR